MIAGPMSMTIRPFFRIIHSMAKKNDNISHIEEAFRKIKQMMVQQRLHPGQKLLYRELTTTLNMSKTPILNALNRLEQEGFVASKPNCGYYVRPIDAREIVDAYEVREALEVKAVEGAILRGTATQIEELEKRFAAYATYTPATFDKKKLMFDAQFHLQIASMSGNKVLTYLLKRNLEHVILRIRLDNYAPNRMDSAVQCHRLLLDALKEKNEEKSTGLIRSHIISSRDYILDCISRKEEEDLSSLSFFASDVE